MTTPTIVLGRADFRAPRQTWRGFVAAFVARLLAFDQLFREREMLAELDDRILRDIGLSRADVAAALTRRDEHLRSILLRGRNQFQH